VAVIALARQDIAGYVSLVDPLHDDHDRRALIIEAVGHRFSKEPYRLFALDLALGGDHVVWIIEDDAITTLAGTHTAGRGGELEPGHVVFNLTLIHLAHGERSPHSWR
jgi:hypothetical protein